MTMTRDTYDHNRGVEEAQRLDDQGRFMSLNLGYEIHPSIASVSSLDAKTVADIGCGTGDFLIRLSQNGSSTSEYHGFDLSAELFRASLPDNVRLHVADAKKPFPTDFHGKFDIVHLRLLVAGLLEHEWQIVMNNVLPLLKPGGAVQWTEADFPSTKRLRGLPGTSAAALNEILSTMQGAMSHHYSFGFNILPDIFKGAGLSGVCQDIVASDHLAETRKAFTKMNLRAGVGWARWMASHRGQPFWSEARLDELEAAAQEEIAAGAYVRYDMYVCIGFKA